jgi:hypothetical protein
MQGDTHDSLGAEVSLCSRPSRAKTKIARAEMPPGASRFSTLFYVAAIGGK